MAALRPLVASLLLTACGTTPAAVDAASPPDTGSPGHDAAVVIDAGSPGLDAATVVTDDAGEATYMVAAGDCFTLATATSAVSGGLSCGDFMALMGSNVDLESSGSASTFCELPGTYTSLASVPTSYASCTWESYVEGGSGLANHGLIVRDAAGAHHYRVRVVTNTLPALVLSLAAID